MTTPIESRTLPGQVAPTRPAGEGPQDALAVALPGARVEGVDSAGAVSLRGAHGVTLSLRAATRGGLEGSADGGDWRALRADELTAVRPALYWAERQCRRAVSTERLQGEGLDESDRETIGAALVAAGGPRRRTADAGHDAAAGGLVATVARALGVARSPGPPPPTAGRVDFARAVPGEVLCAWSGDWKTMALRAGEVDVTLRRSAQGGIDAAVGDGAWRRLEPQELSALAAALAPYAAYRASGPVPSSLDGRPDAWRPRPPPASVDARPDVANLERQLAALISALR